jgi:lipoprotein-anchoring transpeptidase ErfK/SrfK
MAFIINTLGIEAWPLDQSHNARAGGRFTNVDDRRGCDQAPRNIQSIKGLGGWGMARCRLMRVQFMALVALLLLPDPAAAASADVQAINEAQWQANAKSKSGIDPALVKAQVLLDRARFSPGEIDGKLGDNVKKAITAFAAESDLPATAEMNEEVWQELVSTSEEPILKEYVITKEDVKGPFLKRLPAKMENMKDLPALSYTSPREKIAEKFHMSEELLSRLNPEQKFETAGATIFVANVGADTLSRKVARVEVDKNAQTLRAFARNDELIAFYPITAGSAEKPAPSGRLKVTGISKNPTYRYNPAYAFKGVKTDEPFKIKPGPNNPVGVVWIGLSGEGYGIHGTPDPAKVSKTESHGCIRMTNWDALELASVLTKGTPVDFIGEETARDSKQKRSKKRKSRG